MLKFLKNFFLIFTVLSCSTEPKVELPAWAQNPTRNIDNGYLVYVGHGEDVADERAQFRAEGMALEDLANECSFIPKGTRVEDRFSYKQKYTHMAYAKVAIEYSDCLEASKTLAPDKIKTLANVSFTQQLKRYQDLNETGQMVADETPLEVPQELAAPPARDISKSDTIHFYVTRQYVAYQKEIVVLSPPTAYAPTSPESQKFVTTLQPSTSQIENYQTQNPTVKTTPQPWSSLENKPKIQRPMALAPKVSPKVHPMQVPQHMAQPHAQGGSAKPKQGRKKRRLK